MEKREIKTPSVTEQVKAKEKTGKKRVHPLNKPDLCTDIQAKFSCTSVIVSTIRTNI